MVQDRHIHSVDDERRIRGPAEEGGRCVGEANERTNEPTVRPGTFGRASPEKRLFESDTSFLFQDKRTNERTNERRYVLDTS